MRRTAAVALTALLGGCFDLAFAPDDGSWDSCQDGCLSLMPDHFNILVGDTARIHAFSLSGNQSLSWTVTGAAIAFLVEGATTQSQNSSTSALLKGLAAGSAEVVAKAPTLTLRAQVKVADSSAITRVELALPVEQTVSTGTSIPLFANLYDAQGTLYRAQPTWGSSDTNVVVLAIKPDDFLGPHTVAFARGTGAAVLTAMFLNRSASVRVTVK